MNVALTVLSRHLERMQISSTGMQKALHTKGMYSHLENYVMTWGRTKATMWLHGAGKENYVMSWGWTEATMWLDGAERGNYVMSWGWTEATMWLHGAGNGNCYVMGLNRGNYVTRWSWKGELCDVMRLNRGNYVTTWSWKGELCDVMGLNRGNYVTTWSWKGEICDVMGLNRGNYVTTWSWIEEPYVITSDRTKDTIRWHGTEQRKLWDMTLSKENRYDMQPNKATMKLRGVKKGTMWCHREEQRKFLYYHKTDCLSFASNITLQVQPRIKVIHSWNRKNCEGRKGWILFQQ